MRTIICIFIGMMGYSLASAQVVHDSVKIHFHQGKHKLEPAFKSNRQTLERIDRSVLKLEKVEVVGSAYRLFETIRLFLNITFNHTLTATTADGDNATTTSNPAGPYLKFVVADDVKTQQDLLWAAPSIDKIKNATENYVMMKRRR